MDTKYLFIVCLVYFTLAEARPKSKILTLGTESEPETKIREKRKYEIPLLKHLEEGGVGTKEAPKEAPREETPVVVLAAADEVKPTEATKGEGSVEGEPESTTLGGLRVKKQSPNNVCIKVGGCGKTVCGPVVSARGPVISDMRAMMQGGKPLLSLPDLHSAAMSDMADGNSKMDRFTPVQGRTVDTIIAPVALGTLGYGTPAAYSAPPTPTVDLAHSFFKPPAMPALAVITTPHQPSHPLIHPWIMPHLMSHIIPHMNGPSYMPNLAYVPHRYEPTRFPEPTQTDIKQPTPVYPQPTYTVSGDNTLLCQPFRNQRLESPYDYIYKPDIAVDKSLNVTDGSKKAQNMDAEEQRRMHEHLRKVNEIKDEISELNRAAQRIVDQQERLTAMQQKQLWGSSGQSSSQTSEHMTHAPYMGSGYYAHPSMPWGYSRSNILSYPRTADDIEFFLNLLRAGKRMGILSDTVSPSVLSTVGDVLKGVQDAGKVQKDGTDGGSRSSDNKSSLEKKSRR